MGRLATGASQWEPSIAVVTVKASPVPKSSTALETFHAHTRVRAELVIRCSRSKGAKRLKRCAIKLECSTASPGADPGADLSGRVWIFGPAPILSFQGFEDVHTGDCTEEVALNHFVPKHVYCRSPILSVHFYHIPTQISPKNTNTYQCRRYCRGLLANFRRSTLTSSSRDVADTPITDITRQGCRCTRSMC